MLMASCPAGPGEESAAFPAFGEEIRCFPLAGRADGLRPDHLALLVDEDCGPVADAGLFQPDPVGPADLTLGVEVRQKGIGDSAQAFGPGLVTVS